MKHIAPLMATVLILAAATPAYAADPVYPPGVRVGIVPMEGLAPATTFGGFETSDHRVKVVVTELPASAFRDVENASKSDSATTNSLKPQGLETAGGRKAYYVIENGKDGADSVKRYSMVLPGPTFSGYVAVQIPESAAKTYTDDAVRKMFATAVVRTQVPVEEQLGLLPFKVTELSAFKTVRTLAPGAAVIIADNDEESGIESAPFLIIGLVGAAPERPEDRGRFAQQAATMIPGLRDGHITTSEPLRINGSAGYETRIEATSGKANTPVTVVQWLVFGGANAALRIIASAPRDEWSNAFPRFRAVRDGIQTH
jgi:hypothetical protein